MSFKFLAMVIFAVCLITSFGPRAVAQETEVYRDFEFRDTIRPDTLRKLDLLPWKENEKATVREVLKTLYDEYPGLVTQIVKYGSIPLYRVNTRQLDHIDQLAYAGPIYVGFFHVDNSLFFKFAVIHELVHIADTHRQYANSVEWRALIEPRIMKILRWRDTSNLSKPLSGWGPVGSQEQAILDEAGLPSFYSASSPAEALAEVIGQTIMSQLHPEYSFQPADELSAYLEKTLLAESEIAYPAGLALQRARALGHQGKFAEAHAAYKKAAIADPNNYWASFGMTSTTYALSPDAEGRRLLLEGIEKAIELVSPTDIRVSLYFYERAAAQMFLNGSTDAMMGICERVNNDYPPHTRSGSGYGAFIICGDAYAANDQPERALEEYEKAVALVPFKRYELSRTIGNLKMALASNESEALKAHDDVMTAQWIALAEKGRPDSMLRLGKMYYWGVQTPRNYAKAVAWLTSAYEADLLDASYFLAEIYGNERGDYYDPGLAHHWAVLSAGSGDIKGRVALGALRIEDGDFDEAKTLLIAAAAEDNARAYYQLGNLFMSEDFADANTAEAINWYEKAAEKDMTDAQYALGMYYLFQAVPKVPGQALHWFALAEAEGHLLSRYEMGMMAGDKSYSGLPKEAPGAAYRWLYLSLNNTQPETQADLPAHKAAKAEELLDRLAPNLGVDAAALKMALDADIEKERAKRPWQR
jgi:hypothetical protein